MNDIRNLAEEGQALLAQARNESSGRSSASLVHVDRQRVVLMGLTAGTSLAEHEAPPAATLQCVTGHVRLYRSDSQEEWLLEDGDLAEIPQARHGVDAISDSVILLTVSL